MTRLWLSAAIGALSFGVAACGDYDEKNVAYDEKDNAAYEAAGNEAYDAPEGNVAYPPPPDDNMSTNNIIDEVPPANATTNRY